MLVISADAEQLVGRAHHICFQCFLASLPSSPLPLLLYDCTHSTKGLAHKFYLGVSCREPDLTQTIIIVVSMISQGKYDTKIKSEVTELIRSLSEI